MSQSAQLELTERDAQRVETILRRYRQRGSSYLLPCLQELQSITHWIDADLAQRVAETLGVPLVQVHNVLEFYTLLYNRPVGRRIVRVCDDLACVVAGSQEIIHACSRHLGVPPTGGVTSDGSTTLEIHPCLGRCEQAPFMMIDDESYGALRPEDVPGLLEKDA